MCPQLGTVVLGTAVTLYEFGPAPLRLSNACSLDLQFVKLYRERLGREERDEPVGGPEVLRVAVAVSGRLAENARGEANRVDDPELANAEAGV